MITKLKLDTESYEEPRKSLIDINSENINTYLEIEHNFAHGLTHKPRFSYVPYNRWRQTKQDNEKVGDS